MPGTKQIRGVVVRGLCNVFETGSRTRGFVNCPLSCRKSTTCRSGSMLVWIGMIGSVVGALHWPTWAGSEPLLATVTVTGVAVVSLPAASRTMAVSTWEPLPGPCVSQFTVYGVERSSTPRCAPSSLNWTP